MRDARSSGPGLLETGAAEAYKFLFFGGLIIDGLWAGAAFTNT